MLKLGVNIDHVATLREARYRGMKLGEPCPVAAAEAALEAGAHGITAHLREDRRHIIDDDIRRLRDEIALPLNFEMAATDEMVAIALDQLPHAACFVPEKREERTTEGGLDVVGGRDYLKPRIEALTAAGIRVSLFIEPDPVQLDCARDLGAPMVELHTGAYCEAVGDERAAQLERIVFAASYAGTIGLECHAGHGLGFDTVEAIARIENIVELNIGHFLIGEAIFGGLENAIAEMRSRMDRARWSP